MAVCPFAGESFVLLTVCVPGTLMLPAGSLSLREWGYG